MHAVLFSFSRGGMVSLIVTAVVAFFGYSSGPVAPVTVGLSGCGEVSNGHVKRLAISVRSRVATQLDALTRP